MTKQYTKEELIQMVKKTEPHWDVQNKVIVKLAGHAVSGPGDLWVWETHQLERMDEEQLFDLYTICENSWK